jgi:hypothetical protein
VKIDPHDRDLTYPVDREKGEDGEWRTRTVGLSRIAHDLIAGAADVTVDPQIVGVPTSDYICFKAVAVMQTPSGQIRGRASVLAWDRELAEDKVDAEVDEWMRKASGWAKYKNRPEQIAIDGKARRRKEWIREREFGSRKVQSKAARNALKSLLALKNKYSVAELEAKEFAVAKWVALPNLEDSNLRRALLQDGALAVSQLYGPPQRAALQLEGTPVNETPQPEFSDPQSTRNVDMNTGEILPDPDKDGVPAVVDNEFAPPQLETPPVWEKITITNWEQCHNWIPTLSTAVATANQQRWYEAGFDDQRRRLCKGTLTDSCSKQHYQAIEYLVNWLGERGLIDGDD